MAPQGGGSGAAAAAARPPYREVEQGALLRHGGTKVAVSDESLAMAPGVFGLLGENGAGKTTTLAMLQGLYPPTAGFARVAGKDCVGEQDLVRLTLGVCPQHDVLWPMLTIREHLQFYARAKGCSAGEEGATVDAMLTRIGLAEFSGRRAEALSGGMRRRLSVGIAMIGTGTRVVLLDELTTGLDPASRRAVWRIVDDSRRAHPGTLFVLVSHDMAEVEALCSGAGGKCAIMTHGRLRCLGSVQHLRERYGGGCLLRVAFEGSWRARGGAEAEGLSVGAVLDASPPTRTWAGARALVEAVFPPGAGSAAVDGGVFQTRALVEQGGDGGGGGGEPEVLVKEKGSAVFAVRVGSALAAGAEVSMAKAFQLMRQRAGEAGIVSWAIEAQTLDAVFGRVVRWYSK
jgi:ABC-type multidrug transport system ATPase subunit